MASEAALGKVLHGELGCLILSVFVPMQRLLCLVGQSVAEKVEMPRHLLAVCRQHPGVIRESAQSGKNMRALRRVLKLLCIQTHREHHREGLENVTHGALEAAGRGIGRYLRQS